MSQTIELTAATWTEISINKAAIIRHKSGSGEVIYSQSVTTPSSDLSLVQVFDESTVGEKVSIDGIIDGVSLWAYAVSSSCKISVTDVEPRAMPVGLFAGYRAMNIQDYNESNKKLGSQWEASIRIVGATLNQRLFTILKIGSKPVDLKSRVLGATGAGVIGRIYELQPEDISSYGTKGVWYNMRFDLADPAVNQPEIEIYASDNIVFAGGAVPSDFATDARKRGADLIVETNAQNQAKGYLPQGAGSNRILYPEKIIMLEILSLEAQNLSSRLEIFEGDLDLPLTQ